MPLAAPPRADKFSRSTYIALVGLACLPIGLIWDISHHVTIGRDTFWTPAHIIIQLGGIIPALLFAFITAQATFRPSEEDYVSSVLFFGIRAPLGVWVTMWGTLAMLTSAPFDDWWHNRYGLDVKIASPPHAILGVGMFAVGMGVLLFLFSCQNRADAQNQNRAGLICAFAVGVLITLWADFITEFSWPNAQHSAKFYNVVALPFPLLLVLAATASSIRGAATIGAAVYTLVMIAMILVLPLFPAHPKLAPIYHPVDHMVPPAFPLLLIAPAAAIDMVCLYFNRAWTSNARPKPWWRDWLLALIAAIVFVLVVLAVQWPFSAFLLSDAADNRFFARSGHWPYFAQPGSWMNEFWHRDPGISVRSILGSIVRAFASARIGLWLGNYLLRLKR